MTISEAFSSGRMVRRASSAKHRGSNGDGWVDPRMFLGHCSVSCNGWWHLTMADIVATDWEVRP
jgi:hypothetical protein